MRLLLGQSEAVASWVAYRIPQMSTGADFGPCQAVGVVTQDGQRLVAGVVFHNFQRAFQNIEVSFAADTPAWLTRNVARGILALPFQQWDCQRITSLTPKKNKAARAFLEKFGFKREGCVKKGFGTDDMIISGLMRDEWAAHRWNVGKVEAGG